MAQDDNTKALASKRREELYNNLKDDYDLGSLSDFNANLDNKEIRRNIYDAAVDAGWEMPDYDQFDRDMTIPTGEVLQQSLQQKLNPAANVPAPETSTRPPEQKEERVNAVNGMTYTQAGLDSLDQGYKAQAVDESGDSMNAKQIQDAMLQKMKEHEPDAWRNESMDVDMDNSGKYAPTSKGQVYDELYKVFGQAVAEAPTSGASAYAQARARAEQMGIGDNDTLVSLLGRVNKQYARDEAQKAVKAIVSKLPERTADPMEAVKAVYYDPEIQKQLHAVANAMGNDYADVVNMFVKPQLREALKMKYGGDDNYWSGVRGLFSDWNTVNDLWESQHVNEVLGNYFAPSINAALEGGEARKQAILGNALEDDANTPEAMKLQRLFNAFREGNKAADPDTMLQALKDNMGGVATEILQDPQTFEEIWNRAEQKKMDVNDYIEKYVAPELQNALVRRFEQEAVKRNLPKDQVEYILRGLTEDNVIAMIANSMLRTDAQNHYMAMADQMTEAGQNPNVNPGLLAEGLRLASGMAADFWLWGGWGKIGGKATQALLSRRLATVAAERGLTEAAAREVLMQEAKASLKGRTLQQVLQRIPQSVVTGTGASTTSSIVRGIRDDESAGEIISNAIRELPGHVMTFGAFGGMSGLTGSITNNWKGWKKLLGKAMGYEGSALTLYGTGEAAKAMNGEDAFENVPKGLLKAHIDQLAMHFASNPGKAVADLYKAMRHPVKWSQTSDAELQKGVLTEEDIADLTGSEDGMRLSEALEQMKPRVSTEAMKDITSPGAYGTEETAKRLADWLNNKDRPLDRKRRVGSLLGFVVPETPETSSDIVNDGENGVTLRTRDQNGNCIRELHFDTQAEAEQWQQQNQQRLQLNDMRELWNGTTKSRRMAAVMAMMGEAGLEEPGDIQAIFDGKADAEVTNAMYDVLQAVAVRSDEPNAPRFYEQGRNISIEDRHEASLKEQRALNLIESQGTDFATDVLAGRDTPDISLPQIYEKYGLVKAKMATIYYNNYALTKGMMDEINSNIDRQVNDANRIVSEYSHPSGNVVAVDVNGHRYYLTDHDVTVNSDGTINAEGRDTVIVRNGETGKVEMVEPRIVKVTGMWPTEDLMRQNEEQLRGDLTKEATDTVEYAPGTPEQPIAEDFYTDADGQRYMTMQVTDDLGRPTWLKVPVDEQGQPIGEPTPLDRDEYRQAKSNEIDAQEHPDMVQTAVNMQEDAEVPGEKIPLTDEVPESAEKQGAVLDNAGGKNINEETVDKNPPASATSRIPVDENGKMLYEQAAAEDTLAYLNEKYGEEKAQKMIATIAANAAKELESLQNADTSGFTDMADLDAHEEKVLAAEQKVKYWHELMKPEEKAVAEEQKPIEEKLPIQKPTISNTENADSQVANQQQSTSPAKPAKPKATSTPPAKPTKPAAEQPAGHTAEQKVAQGTVKNNIGKRFGFQNQDGTRSEVTIDAFKGDDLVTVTRQDYDKNGLAKGDPYQTDFKLTDVSNSIINGLMKPALTTDEKLRRVFKVTVGDIPLADVLTEDEQRQLLDLYSKKDYEAIGNLAGDLIDAHHEDLILRGRDIRNSKVDQIMNSNASREQKLRKVRDLYKGYQDAEVMLEDETLTPGTLEEYVADLHSRVPKKGEGPIAYFSYEKDGTPITGLQDETGYGKKNSGDADAFKPWLAPQGKGVSLMKYAEQIHSQLPEPIQEQFDVNEVRNAILNVFGGAERPSDITTMVIKRGILQAENAARRQEEMWIDGGPSMHKVSADDNSFTGRLTRAKQQTNTEPTDGQKDAGNYKKGHVSFGGYDFVVENPEGSMRRGEANGKKWEQKMNNTYGYILGRYGKDGDHLDMFINDNADLDNWNGKVYVIDQVDPKTGAFDEHKVMYGFDSEAEARDAYLSNYEKGWKGLGKITGVSKDKFDEWLDSSKRKFKPFAEHSIGREAAVEEVRERIGEMEAANNAEAEKQAKPATPYERDKVLMDTYIDHMADGKMKAKISTDVEEAQRILDDYYKSKAAGGSVEGDVKAQKVTDQKELDELNKGKTVKRYRAMQLIDGKLYPPMSAKVNGEMREPTEIGVWEKAEERPDLVKNGKFVLNKGQKGQGNVPAAYNPYFHTSTSGLNDQFTSAYKRPELVVVEVEIPESELTSGYKAEGAKDAVGNVDWHSGVVNGQLPADRQVTLSRYSKVNRIVPDSEVADMIAKQLEGTNIEVPYNVVTPVQRAELEKRGVKNSDKPAGTVTEDINGKSIKDSKPSFFKTPDGYVYGFTYQGKIYVDPRIATSETPVHEYGHLWVQMKRQSAPEEWENIKKVFLNDKLVQPIIDRVKQEYPELAKEGREDDFVEELVTQFSGKRGAERMRDMAQQIAEERGGVFGKAEAVAAMQRMKTLLSEFWASIAKMMGWKYRNANDIADKMMLDFLEGMNPSEEIKKLPKQIRDQRDIERTLMGVHNLSEDKLRKVIKAGGLANPSLAVIDTKQGIHTQYGDISLIPKASLIDKRTGNNAGTFAGDVWTPTYPHVERMLTKQGEKRAAEIAKEVAGDDEEMARHIRSRINDYFEGNGDRMHFLFLKQKGLDPQIRKERIAHSQEEYDAITKIFGEPTSNMPNRESITKEQNDALVDLMVSVYEKKLREGIDPEKPLTEKMQNYLDARVEEYRKNLLDDDGYIWFAKGDNFIYDNWRDEKRRQNPQPDWYGTDNDASYQVAKEGLSEEYEKWKESLLTDDEVEEKLFAGYTPSGNRRYLPNTVENASRLMNKNADQNAYDQGGFGPTRAMLLQNFASLADIRRHKDLIQKDEKVEERTKELSDELFDIINQISDMQKISDNRFSNIDYAEARLQEAMGKKNPIRHLNKEYGYDIPEDGELASQLMNFMDDVRNLPAKYFETKFKRPVTLDEFEIAVVPEDTSEDVVKALKDAGLEVRTFDNTGGEEVKNENRRQAVMDAVQGRDDIMFQMMGEKGAAVADKLENNAKRMESLKLAEEAEEGGYDAKAIKFATGWERGADGKWRYEIPDADVDIVNAYKQARLDHDKEVARLSKEEDGLLEQYQHLTNIIPGRIDSRYSEEQKAKYREMRKQREKLWKQYLKAGEKVKEYDEQGVSMSLGELMGEDNEVFKYYPELKDVKVSFTSMQGGTAGSFGEDGIKIGYNELKRFDNDELNNENVYATLLHEVQHAIQDIEGFASGGNLYTSTTEEGISAIVEKKQRKAADIKQRLDANRKILSDPEELKAAAELDGKSEKEVKEQLMETIDQQAAEYDTLNNQIEYIKNTKAPAKSDAVDLYRRLSGEVESRNVESRMKLTDQERMATLASETEDVPRDEQVIIKGNSGESASMGDGSETFDERQKRAVENYGIVMPGLNDKSVEVIEVPKHQYTGSWEQARKAAIKDAKEKYTRLEKDNKGKEKRVPIPQQYDNFGQSFKYTISGESIAESVNKNQVDKSLEQNAPRGVHLSVLNHLDEVINNSIEVEEHPDYNKGDDDKRRPENGFNPSVLMHRFIGVVNVDGTPYRVMTLMKEFKQKELQPKEYAYDVEKIEVLDDMPNTSNGAGKAISGPYPLANLLKDIVKSYEKEKNLLKESEKLTNLSKNGQESASQKEESDIRFQKAPIFISNALKAAEDIKQEKATPEQWLAMLQKNGGLKAGEDKWLGLSDWLKQQKGSVTKQDVLGYIRKNQIQVEETPYQEYVDVDNNPKMQEFGDEFNKIKLEIEGNRSNLEVELDKFEDEMSKKYGYGWYNKLNDEEKAYAEKFEQLNSTEGTPDEKAFREMVDRYGDDFEMAFEVDGNGRLVPQMDMYGDDISDVAKHFLEFDVQPINSTRLGYTTEGLDNKREIALTVPTIEPWNEGDQIHFGDAANGRAVAWVRFGDAYYNKNGEPTEVDSQWDAFMSKMAKKYGKDRQDTLGLLTEMTDEERETMNKLDKQITEKEKRNMGRVLVIDEIQSKRHQEGREKGYKGDVQKSWEDSHEANKVLNDYLRELKQKYGTSDIDQLRELSSPEEMSKLEELRLDYEDKHNIFLRDKNAIPDAPFEKNWHELAMKRMLRYAAENGYDKIAWTTGEQQTDRYDIGDKIKDISVSVATDPMTGKPLKGKYEIFPHNHNNSTIMVDGASGVMDKDQVLRVYGKDLGQRMIDAADKAGVDGDVLSGDALRIGAEGMKGFYDEILPRFMNKYGKKWGVKVGEVELPDLEKSAQKMWSIDVTPEMKESVMQGQPMFQRASQPESELTPENEQYWKQWDAAMKKWKERNNIPADAEGVGEKPVFRQGEDLMDFAGQMSKWITERNLWQTAPKLEDYRQARNDKADVDEAHAYEKQYPDSEHVRRWRVAADLARIRHAMSRQKTYDKATVKAVTDFANDFMKMGYGDHLTRGEIERMLSSVKNATGSKDVKKQLDNIMNVLMNSHLRNLESQVWKLASIKELKQTAQGVETQGRLELKGQRMIQAFREATQTRLTPDEIRNRMEEVAERMTRNDEEAPMWEQEYEGLGIALQYAENIEESRKEWAEIDREYKEAVKDYKTSGRTYQAQQELLESLEQAKMDNIAERIANYGGIIGRLEGNIAESIQGAKEFVEREKQRVKKIHDMANFDLAGKDMGGFHQSDWKKRLSNGTAARFFLGPLGTFEQMLKQFGARNANGEGYLYDYFMRNWMQATDNAYVGERNAKEELDEKAHELFGDKIKRWSDLYELERTLPTMDVTVTDQGEQKTFTLTQGNLMYIYMADKMNDGRMKLRKMGITEEDVQQIKDFLDPRLVQLADWLQGEYLPSKRPEYNKVHERMFGAPMAAIDNYFPLKILGDARVKEEDVNVPDSETLPSTITGNIIKRRKNALPLDILNTDALSLAIEHVEDMERWAAQAEWNKDVNTLLSYTTFRNKVKNMNTIYGSGDQLWNAFKDAAKMAAGTYSPKVSNGSTDKAISNIAKGVTAAKISFRAYTALKQLLSAPAFLHDVDLKDFVKAGANPLGSFRWAMENMPVFEKRWKSRQMGDTRLMDDPTDWKLWKNNVVQLASRWGMSPNALVDGVTCAVGARAIYETRLKKYKEMGIEEDAAKKRALQDAEIGYNLTQQSSEGAFVSQIQKDRTVAANMLSVFRNSSMAYTRQWVDAARNLKHRMQAGYKEDSIKFMTRQFQDQMGLDEAQAQEAAEAAYNRAGRHDVARLLNMMYGVTIAWNLGASLPYLLIGDDDETKKEMMTDALMRGLAAGPTEGLAAGNIYSELMGRALSEQTRKAYDQQGLGAAVDEGLSQAADYEINPLPLFADIQGMIKKLGYDKWAAAQDVFNIVAQSAVGVNPQTFTDMYNAIMDYAAPGWDGTKYTYDAENMSCAKELALFFMRVMNAPTSSWRNKYIDELGMNAEDAQKLPYDEMAKRYAHYKHWKDAPIMGWMRGEAGRQEKMEKIQKQFDNAVKERMERLTDEELVTNLQRTQSAEERRALANTISRRFFGTNSVDGKKPTEDEEWQKNYQSLMEYNDIKEDQQLSVMKKQVKEKKDKKAYDEIDKLGDWMRDGRKVDGIIVAKGKKQLYTGNNQEVMDNIRKWRKEALEIAEQSLSK